MKVKVNETMEKFGASLVELLTTHLKCDPNYTLFSAINQKPKRSDQSLQ